VWTALERHAQASTDESAHGVLDRCRLALFCDRVDVVGEVRHVELDINVPVALKRFMRALRSNVQWSVRRGAHRNVKRRLGNERRPLGAGRRELDGADCVDQVDRHRRHDGQRGEGLAEPGMQFRDTDESRERHHKRIQIPATGVRAVGVTRRRDDLLVMRTGVRSLVRVRHGTVMSRPRRARGRCLRGHVETAAQGYGECEHRQELQSERHRSDPTNEPLLRSAGRHFPIRLP